jgi:homoserine O-acetyltransferase
VIAQKHVYYTPKLDLEVGESIAVTVGYETHGRLSPNRDNVILICHHFSGTSHAAGRYHHDDLTTGWWDGLIGPGQAFDTDQYFIIAVDMLCNLNVKSPLVTTTGPASINSVTGRPYGQTFPQVTIRDNVRLQRQLLKSLEIERLVCVAGPSMGGFQALEWAVTYPHLVERVIAVASNYAAPPVFALAVCQAGIDAIMADPAFREGNFYGEDGPLDGLTRATLILTTLARSDDWIEGKWRRKTAAGSPLPWADSQGRFAFQSEMEQLARERAQTYDANHYCYLARTSILHDIGHGTGGLEGAAQRIQAKVLMLPISSDLYFPAEGNRRFVDAVNEAGGSADMILTESPNGHLAAIYECNRFTEAISRFLCRNGVH